MKQKFTIQYLVIFLKKKFYVLHREFASPSLSHYSVVKQISQKSNKTRNTTIQPTTLQSVSTTSTARTSSRLAAKNKWIKYNILSIFLHIFAALANLGEDEVQPRAPRWRFEPHRSPHTWVAARSQTYTLQDRLFSVMLSLVWYLAIISIMIGSCTRNLKVVI